MKKIILNKLFFIRFCLLLIIIQFVQIIYFQQSYIFDNYDVSYWKDRYEHSQYGLPLSQRIIGDDGVYAYIGYQLIKGGDPSLIDAQVPPAAKYIIGFFILIFHNQVYYALFMGIGCLLLFYIISRLLLDDAMDAIFVTSLLFIDPLFFTQFWKTWIDITQLFFILLNITFLLYLKKSYFKKKIIFAFFCGFALGLFAETKIPVLLPIIFLLESVYFFLYNLKKEYIVFLIGTGLAILCSYGKYFLLGYSLLDFLKLQKFIAAFWLQSKLEVHKSAIWQVLLSGQFPDIATGVLGKVSEWWISWPVITIIGITCGIYYIFSKNTSYFWRGIAIFTIGGLIVYTYIPAYPRYLILILPFLYLLTMKAVNNFLFPFTKILIFYSILLFGIVYATWYLVPLPDNMLKTFYHSFSHQYFQDIYQENLSKNNQSTMSQKEFRMASQLLMNQATVRAIEINEIENNISKFNTDGEVKIKVTYYTQDIGAFSEEKIIKLKKENEKWKIQWNWDILIKDFKPGYIIDVKTTLGRRGSIIATSGAILAEDTEGYLVAVNPDKMDTKREISMLKSISDVSYKGEVELQNAYLENGLPNSYIPIATTYILLNEKTKSNLLSYPGIKLIPYPTRIYRVSEESKMIANKSFKERNMRIYSSYSYHGITGLEKLYDTVLSGYSGGIILLKNKNGDIVRKILEKQAKNGQNIIIPSL